MKHTILVILGISHFLIACNPPHKILVDEYENEKPSFKVERFVFKHKSKSFRQITATVYKEGRQYLVYSLSTKCGCFGKSTHNDGITHYKAIDHYNKEIIPLDSTDRYVIEKITQLPNIEEYCSKALLDSAKGFIKTK